MGRQYRRMAKGVKLPAEDKDRWDAPIPFPTDAGPRPKGMPNYRKCVIPDDYDFSAYAFS